jgi:hypothetical protein
LRNVSCQINALEILFKEDQDNICVSFKNRKNGMNAVELSQFCRQDRCVGAASISHSPMIYCASTAGLADPRLVCGCCRVFVTSSIGLKSRLMVLLWSSGNVSGKDQPYGSLFSTKAPSLSDPTSLTPRNGSAAVLFLPMAARTSVTPTNMVT